MDSEIVLKAKSGDAQALEQIYNETRQMVYFTALSIVKNEEDAEDLVQDTYIKVFENIYRLQDEKAFLKWLKTIAVNISKNYLKKKKPMLFQDDEQEDAVIGNIEEIGEDFLPQEYVDHAEKREIIKKIVDDLPDAQRTAVILYYYNELPLSEVSKFMETADGTTKSRLNYARKQIRTKVFEEEEKGNRLYAGVPMLTKILHMVSQNYDLPAETAKHILANSLQAANIAAGTAASSSVSAAGSGVAGQAAAASSTAAETGKVAAAKGILAKIAGMTVETRVIALISAAVVIAGGAGAVVAIQQKQAADRAAIVLQQKPKAQSAAKAKAAAEKKAAEEAAAKKKAKEQNAAETKSHNLELYKTYYEANFGGKTNAVFFADLTHDGFDEMLVACKNDNGPTGTLYVDTVDGDAVKEIYQHTLDTSMAFNGEIYLYTENKKSYLFLPYCSLHFTYNYVLKYDVFSLSGNGDHINFQNGDSETAANDDGSNFRYVGGSGDSKQNMENVQKAIDNYKAKSTLLVSTVDLEHAVLGKGSSDPFGSVSSSSSHTASSGTSSTASTSQYAISYLNMTLKQFTDKYGSDYMDYGNESGGAVIGYDDKRLAYRFSLNSANLNSTDKIVMVTVPEGMWVDSQLKSGLTLNELKAVAGSSVKNPTLDEETDDWKVAIDKPNYSVIYGWDNQSGSGKSYTQVFSNNKS